MNDSEVMARILGDISRIGDEPSLCIVEDLASGFGVASFWLAIRRNSGVVPIARKRGDAKRMRANPRSRHSRAAAQLLAGTAA